MAAIVGLVADLRGEQAPTTQLFDPRTSGVRPIGNPNRKRRKKGGQR
jgi:hypothetical protein